MFILKFFDSSESYTAHSCDSYQIIKEDGQRFAVIDGHKRLPIAQKLIVENGEGKTVDVLRGGRHGLV